MQAPQQGEHVVEVRGLHKAFGKNKVLHGFDMDVHRGENVMVLGKSGSGKSVLIKCMVGLLRPDEGHVSVLGNDVFALDHDALDRLRVKIGFLFQSSALYDSMTVRENLEFPLRRHWIAQKEEERENLVLEALENVGLSKAIDLYPSELSGGMRRRIGLARTLILKPEVVLYDEPTTGLDPIAGARIDAVIRRVWSHLGVTSIAVTHDMASARRISDRILMLHEGVIHADGPTPDILGSHDPVVYNFVNGIATAPAPTTSVRT